jgi:hypothetical protein
MDNERMDPRPHPESKGNQTSQEIRGSGERLGRIPVRMGDVGEDDEWDLITGVPALINSINRSCFFASVKKRWLPTSSLSGERLMYWRLGFCEMVSSVSFQRAGS